MSSWTGLNVAATARDALTESEVVQTSLAIFVITRVRSETFVFVGTYFEVLEIDRALFAVGRDCTAGSKGMLELEVLRVVELVVRRKKLFETLGPDSSSKAWPSAPALVDCGVEEESCLEGSGKCVASPSLARVLDPAFGKAGVVDGNGRVTSDTGFVRLDVCGGVVVIK